MWHKKIILGEKTGKKLDVTLKAILHKRVSILVGCLEVGLKLTSELIFPTLDFLGGGSVAFRVLVSLCLYASGAALTL